MSETFVYKLGDNLYVNLTNRCSNACDFCIRKNGSSVGDGEDLWLTREPTADDVIRGIKSYDSYDDVVFCGYGEPTYKLETMLEVAAYVRSIGKKTRLNTNGHGNLINGRDITREIAENIDVVSVSLNSDDAAGYQKLCHCVYGESGYAALIEFTRGVIACGGNAVMSIVDFGNVDIEKCKAVAKSAGADLRVREYISQ